MRWWTALLLLVVVFTVKIEKSWAQATPAKPAAWFTLAHLNVACPQKMVLAWINLSYFRKAWLASTPVEMVGILKSRESATPNWVGEVKSQAFDLGAVEAAALGLERVLDSKKFYPGEKPKKIAALKKTLVEYLFRAAIRGIREVSLGVYRSVDGLASPERGFDVFELVMTHQDNSTSRIIGWPREGTTALYAHISRGLGETADAYFEATVLTGVGVDANSPEGNGHRNFVLQGLRNQSLVKVNMPGLPTGSGQELSN